MGNSRYYILCRACGEKTYLEGKHKPRLCRCGKPFPPNTRLIECAERESSNNASDPAIADEVLPIDEESVSYAENLLESSDSSVSETGDIAPDSLSEPQINYGVRVDDNIGNKGKYEIAGGSDSTHTLHKIPDSLYLTSGDRKLEITTENQWIGRNSFENHFLETNLAVSREHVSVRVEKGRGLAVTDYKSKNGTFVDTGNGKVKIDRNEEVILVPGNILWLYNVPLLVEDKSDD